MAGCPGIPGRIKSERVAECYRNPRPDDPGIRSLTSVDDLIHAEGQKLDALKAHKKGLMQQLFPASDEVSG